MNEEQYQEIKRYYNECKVDVSLKPGDKKYVDFDKEELRGPKCREQLCKRIEFDDDNSHLLFSGYRGGGKTTELFLLKEALEKMGYLVIYGDAKQYMNLTMPLSVGEILLSLAGVFDDFFKDELKVDLGKEGIWERLKEFAGTEIQFQEFGISAGGVEVKAALVGNQTFKKQLNDFMAQRLQNFKKLVYDYINEAVALATKKCKDRFDGDCKDVVLIFDSLEQLRGDTPYAQEVRQSLSEVFFHMSDYLQIPCSAVYTVPPWMAFQAGVEAEWDVCQFGMVRVRHKDGSEDEKGLQKLREFIDRRVPLQDVFGNENSSVIHDMVLCTGGYLRDLLRCVRDFLIEVNKNDDLPLPEDRQKEIWEKVRIRLANEYHTPLVKEDLEWFAQIHDTKDLEQTRHKEMEKIAGFLDYHFILGYRDKENKWYDLHPILAEHPAVKNLCD